jgi:hypothetical protein
MPVPLAGAPVHCLYICLFLYLLPHVQPGPALSAAIRVAGEGGNVTTPGGGEAADFCIACFRAWAGC